MFIVALVMTETTRLLGIAELADAIGLHRATADRYFLLGVLVPDAFIKYGTSERPMFESDRLDAFRKAVEAYRAKRRNKKCA
jgi:hypothetical protein